MTPEETRKQLDQHAELLRDLRALHDGRVVPGNLDLASEEARLQRELQGVSDALSEAQLIEQQNRSALRPSQARMSALALSFPSITERMPGISPWDADRLNAWILKGVASHGEKCALEFLLYVWNPHPDTAWAGRFSLEEALRIWDIFHRHAFLRWVESPWWP